MQGKTSKSSKPMGARDQQKCDSDLLISYIRDKVDQLLNVMGTSAINPHELDDQTLIELDPIGIICSSFSHVLDNLRQTNAELHLAHDEIETIFDTAGAAIMVLNPKRQIVAYNRKVDEFFLHGRKSVLGMDCSDVVCNGGGACDNCSFERIVSQGLSDQNLEWTFQGRSFDVVGKSILDEQGEVTHVVLSYNDISDRKRSMQALQEALLEAHEAKNRINGILRSVEDALIVSDDTGHVVLMNETAEKLLSGADELSMAGNDFVAALYAHLQKGTDQVGLWVTDVPLLSGEGNERIFQARSSQVSQQGGERGGVVTFLHEVTREREIEKLKSEFVSTAAHELRTPLSTILGFSELILNERDLPAEDLREYVGIIHQKAEGLALIVSDLLDISRIEAGDSLPLEPEQCDLKELCEDALLGFKVYGDKYTFELSLPETEISVKADRFAIAQVLENILSNAVKYSPEGSVITLEVDAQKEEAQICVADQGMGMFPEQVERVYDKFYRADASNTAIPGTGLGMTIVKHIVDAHGGKVWIDSAPQQGTRVYFTLPLS